MSTNKKPLEVAATTTRGTSEARNYYSILTPGYQSRDQICDEIAARHGLDWSQGWTPEELARLEGAPYAPAENMRLVLDLAHRVSEHGYELEYPDLIDLICSYYGKPVNLLRADVDVDKVSDTILARAGRALLVGLLRPGELAV